ncbi:MAG: adenylyltransferase/cytidyltransferase family protein [Anaerolineae bacterium]|nr:adenylyltransferase/cytidyltransferase family protein [Anaerolineae bacterium]
MGRVLSWEAARAWREELRAAGRRLAFTNGHFDLLHVGHLDYLEAARALGNALCVGLNGDASTRALKGPSRPFVPQEERARLLAALACVDAVVVFDSPTAEALVAALEPDVYVKGGDWNLATRIPPEATVAQSYGAEVRFLPYLPEHSTTALVERIVRRYAGGAR